MRRITVAVIALSVTCGIAGAQHTQPYAGMQERSIKALSAEQIADLEAGRGMGFALAAELNGYPGPVHVIELADPLRLTQEQRARMKGLVQSMKADAIPLGERLIAQEAELDRQFAQKSVSEASLLAATSAIGATQADLRAAHLKYHLLTVEALTPAQVQRYRELRGYAEASAPSHGHGGHHAPN